MATEMTDEEVSKKPKRYKMQHQLVFLHLFQLEGKPPEGRRLPMEAAQRFKT